MSSFGDVVFRQFTPSGAAQQQVRWMHIPTLVTLGHEHRAYIVIVHVSSEPQSHESSCMLMIRRLQLAMDIYDWRDARTRDL
jgi:hypothetical protein